MSAISGGLSGVLPAIGPLRRGLLTLRESVVRRPLARFYDAVTLVWVIAFHRILGAKFLSAQFGFDERYFLNEGWSLSKGLVPYRDFQEFKPPMIFIVNALGLKLYGLDKLAFRHIFSMLSLTGFLSLTVALLSRGVNRLFVAAIAALMINLYFDSAWHDSSINDAESVGLDFFMIGCGILLIETKWVRLQQIVGAGFLTLSPLSKEPLVFATVMAWLALLLLHRFESSRRDAVKRFAFFTVTTAVAIALVWLVYMLKTHSLGWYIVQLKLTFKYTKSYAYQLGWFPKSTEGEFKEIWKRLRDTYVNAARIGLFLPLFVALVALWRKRTMVGVVALATFVAALYAVTIGHGFAAHYYIMAMTGTFFCVVTGAIALDDYSMRMGTPMRRWVGLSWAAITFMTLWPRFSDEWDKYGTYQPPEPPVAADELAFVLAHSHPGDTIWTLGNPLLYVYSDRVSAFREGIVTDEIIEYYPGATDEQRLAGQRDELMANRPKLVILGDDLVGYQRKQRFMKALVTPFLEGCGYTKVGEKFYVRP